MKVLQVIPSLSAIHGGPTRALQDIESALAAQGIDVDTATTDDDGRRRNGKPCGVRLQEGVAHRWYFARRTRFYKAAPAFSRWIRRHARDYDVIHIHALFSFTTPAAAWAAHRAGVPYVVRPLGTLAPWAVTQRRPWLKQLSLHFIEGPLLERAAAVHFTSELEAAEASRLGLAIKPVVIPLGVALAPPAATHAPGGSLGLLFLSRLDPKKNLEAAIDALVLLRQEQFFPRLVVAGSGDDAYVRSLRARAESTGVSAQVEWLGHVEGEAKERAFAAADVFVLPSHSENFGIAAAEALAHGLPCILGQDVAIARDVAAAGAGVAIEPSARALADAISRLRREPAARAAMSARARELAQARYSLATMGIRLRNLYESILAR